MYLLEFFVIFCHFVIYCNIKFSLFNYCSYCHNLTQPLLGLIKHPNSDSDCDLATPLIKKSIWYLRDKSQMIVIIWTVSQNSVRKMETDVNSGCLKWQSELTVEMFSFLFFLCGKMCWTVESKNFQYIGKHKELPVLPSNSKYSSPEANTLKKSCHWAAIFKCHLHLFGQLYWRIIYIIFCGHTDINTACNQQLTWLKKKKKTFFLLLSFNFYHPLCWVLNCPINWCYLSYTWLC